MWVPLSSSKTELTQLTSFHLPYRKASSGLPAMFSKILLEVKLSQEILSFTILLTGTNVCLRLLLFLLVLYFEFCNGKQNSIPYMWKIIHTYLCSYWGWGRWILWLFLHYDLLMVGYTDSDDSCKVIPFPTEFTEVFLILCYRLWFDWCSKWVNLLLDVP